MDDDARELSPSMRVRLANTENGVTEINEAKRFLSLDRGFFL